MREQSAQFNQTLGVKVAPEMHGWLVMYAAQQTIKERRRVTITEVVVNLINELRERVAPENRNGKTKATR